MKKIYAYLNDTSRGLFANKKGRTYGNVLLCSYDGECPSLKKNICCAYGSSGSCPYAKTNTETGPTHYSSRYTKWTNEFKEANKDVFGIHITGTNSIAIAGDAVYIPVNLLIENKNVKWLSGSSALFVSRYPTISKDDFTAQFIIDNILEFVPRTIFENKPVKKYPEEELPKFMRKLREFDINLFNEVLEAKPEYKERFSFISSIGRKADLRTLNPNVGTYKDIHGADWKYDGKYIISVNSKFSFALVERRQVTEIRLELKADEPIWVTVSDDMQCNENTVFKD